MLLFIVLGCSACGIKSNDSLLESNENEILREDNSKENESNQGHSKEDYKNHVKDLCIEFDCAGKKELVELLSGNFYMNTEEIT